MSENSLGTAAIAIPVKVGRCGHALTGSQRVWCGTACSKQAAQAALLDKRFNLSSTEYDQILAAQGGCCPVCLKAPTTKRFPVDHDHKTGIIRGIPCLNCNLIFIGKNRDPEKYRRAYNYLLNPPAVTVLGERIANTRPRAKRRSRAAGSTRTTRRTYR